MSEYTRDINCSLYGRIATSFYRFRMKRFRKRLKAHLGAGIIAPYHRQSDIIYIDTPSTETTQIHGDLEMRHDGRKRYLSLTCTISGNERQHFDETIAGLKPIFFFFFKDCNYKELTQSPQTHDQTTEL